MSFGPTIYLTQAKDGTRIPVKACDIVSVQEGSSADAGGPPSTRVYISPQGEYHVMMLEIRETPKDIGSLIVDELVKAKDISPKIEDVREEIRVR